MTTALPPSGRSSILLGVNSSIEPFLTFEQTDHAPLLCRLMAEDGLLTVGPGGTVLTAMRPNAPQNTARSSLFRRAIDIPAAEHLAVLAEAAALVDDGVSKTVNLREDASRSEVSDIYLEAWRGGLKAISVYRERPPQMCAPALRVNCG